MGCLNDSSQTFPELLSVAEERCRFCCVAFGIASKRDLRRSHIQDSTLAVIGAWPSREQDGKGPIVEVVVLELR